MEASAASINAFASAGLSKLNMPLSEKQFFFPFPLGSERERRNTYALPSSFALRPAFENFALSCRASHFLFRRVGAALPAMRMAWVLSLTFFSRGVVAMASFSSSLPQSALRAHGAFRKVSPEPHTL